MSVQEIVRTVRVYDFKAMQEVRKDLWKEVRFEPIANRIQSYPADESASPSRYVIKDGERWIAEFRIIQKNEIYGVFWQTVVNGLPVEELGGNFSPLGIRPGGGVSEPCAFGLFDNRYLVYHLNRRGPEAGSLGYYIMKMFNSRFKVEIVPAKRRTFEAILPKIVAFTVLHVRSRFDRIGRIKVSEEDDSLISILKRLSRRTRQNAEIKISAGRHASPNDAFEQEFANFLKEHLSNPENYDDFDILLGSALLQSGDIKPIDIMDKHIIEKKVKLRLDKNRGLDLGDAITKISTAYIGMRGQLSERKTEV